MASGLEWTIVRCAFFAQNFTEGAWLDEVLAGAVSLTVDQVLEPFTAVLGSKARLADGVHRALGREPKDFADFPVRLPRRECGRREFKSR